MAWVRGVALCEELGNGIEMKLRRALGTKFNQVEKDWVTENLRVLAASGASLGERIQSSSVLGARQKKCWSGR